MVFSPSLTKSNINLGLVSGLKISYDFSLQCLAGDMNNSPYYMSIQCYDATFAIDIDQSIELNIYDAIL